VIKNHDHVVEVLLKNGADATIKDNDGKTPIDYAREMGYTHLLDVLKKKGSS
jgi:ankyrin repeat protein